MATRVWCLFSTEGNLSYPDLHNIFEDEDEANRMAALLNKKGGWGDGDFMVQEWEISPKGSVCPS